MQALRAGERSDSVGADGGSIARAVLVLDTLNDADAPLGVSEIARRCGLPKSSAQRMLLALLDHRLLEREGTSYKLGLKLFELGQQVPHQRDLREAARPFMSDLREATGHRVHLAVLDGEEVVYLEVFRGAEGPPLPTRMGARWPAHGTGIGKAILAFSQPSVVQRVLRTGLPRLSERTISSPGLFVAELERIEARARHTTWRNREQGWCARRARLSESTAPPSRVSPSPDGTTVSISTALRPRSALRRWGCPVNCRPARRGPDSPCRRRPCRHLDS